MLKPEYTTQEMQKLLSLTAASILARAKREAWQAKPKPGKGGGSLWVVSSMPSTTQAQIAGAEAVLEQKHKTELVVASKLPDNVVVPDWAFDLAKARYRIVAEWRAHTSKQCNKQCSDRVSKKESTIAFVSAYNAGLLLPEALRKQVTEISLPTLYRWEAELKKHHDDLLVLADRRGKWRQGGAKGLGQIGAEAESAFLKLYLHENRPTMMMAYRALETVLQSQNLPTPSYSGVRRFFERFEAMHNDVVTLMREGEKAYEDKVGPYLSRNDRILQVGDVLIADGHKMNFTVINPETGKPSRFTLVGWQDWASRMFMGFEIMLEENTQAIASSLHSSIIALGKMPGCVYIDNGKAFKNKFFSASADLQELDGLYLRLGIHVQHSKPYVARSKIIERWWEDFDQQAARALESYVGANIDTKPAHLHRNEKWHKKRHSEYVPTIEEVKQIVIEFAKWKAIQPHPTRPATTPWAVFNAGRGAGFGDEKLAELGRHFMHRKVVHPSRCRFTMLGLTFEADALHGLKKDLVAYFSHANLAQVYVFDGSYYLGIAKPVEYVHPLAELMGSDFDLQTLRNKQKEQAKLRADTRKTAEQIGGSGKELLLGLPHMQGIAERRQPLQVVPRSKNIEALEPQTPALTEAESKQLTEVIAKHKAKVAAEPLYTVPTYFSSELERYELLFKISTEKNVELRPEDTSFMLQYENSDEYKIVGRRYEQLRRLYPKQNKAEAIA